MLLANRSHHLYREQCLPTPVKEGLITPGPVTMRTGTLIDYRLRVHRLPLRWTSRIERWEPGRAFQDTQVKGPYRLWHHRHDFQPVGGGTLVRDHVRYALPLGPLGQIAHLAVVRRDLERIFDYRQATVAELLG